MSTTKFTIRFYPEQDADLLDFLNQVRNGDKNQAIKDTLRRGIRSERRDGLAPLDPDRDGIRQAIQEVLWDVVPDVVGQIDAGENGAGTALPFGLTDIRQVVEVALQEHADRLVTRRPIPAAEPEVDGELDALMDSLGQSMLR